MELDFKNKRKISGEMITRGVKRRTFEIIQIGKDQDIQSIAFDFFIAVVIVANLFVTLFETFSVAQPFMKLLLTVDFITMVLFGIEYSLRVWTAEYLYPEKSPAKAKLAYMRSFYGVIEMLAFLTYFLSVFFLMGLVAFRMFRVARIFRLFRINTYYDAFNVITDILNEKKDQIFSSVCIIMILMIASSLCMYSLEHDVQPDKFQNAFSGIWWSMSTLLTVGYGDIYPIISAGFVEQYTKLKTISTYSDESDIRFITLKIDEGHIWQNLPMEKIFLPPGLILAVICRGNRTIVPRGDTVLEAGDKLVIGAEDMVIMYTKRDVRDSVEINL